MNYALTMYPLSNGFRTRLEHELAASPVYLNVHELRKLSMREASRRLRSLRGARLVLPLEDESSRSVLPVLKAIAAFSNARRVEVRFPDLGVRRVSRWELATSLGSLAGASAALARDALACRRELAALVPAPRLDAPLRASGAALYLNATLWFGVKAGGSIGHVAGVVNGLHERGCPVTYASAVGGPMIRESVPQIALQAPAVFGVPSELNAYRFHRMVTAQLSSLEPPRFVYQRLSVGNYAGAVLARRWRVPLVIEYNGSEAWIAKHWGRPLRWHDLAVQAEDACLRQAHVVVTISEVLRDELTARGVAPERIVCYPNCIDPTVFDPGRFSAADRADLRRRADVPADALLVTFVGTFGRWHGADVLALAIRRLVETDQAWLRRRRVHFLLVGDGLTMPAVRETLAGCGEFVTFTGLVPQADAPAYLAASDVLVSPHVANADGSRFFGSPTKLFEYMAMGKAIVASDLDQIGAVLRHSVRAGALPDAPPSGETRLSVLFPPGDVAALVESLTFAADRPLWRAALGANARREALARYTWSDHVAAILERIGDVCR